MKHHHDKTALRLLSKINEMSLMMMVNIEPEDPKESISLLPEEVRDMIGWLGEIHWISHELECRLGGHGGYQYATGPCLMEIPPQVSDHLRKLCK